MKSLARSLVLLTLAALLVSAAACSKSAEEKAPAAGETSARSEAAPAPAPETHEAKVTETAGPVEPVEAAKPEAGEGVIAMDDKAYAKHVKPIVLFTHDKHFEAHGISCGECHHDQNGKPLNDLTPGDDVEGCIACHKIPGEMPRDEKNAIKDLPPEEKQKKMLAYHAEAVHENCRNCHKEWNKEQGKTSKDGAPVSCTQCHAK